MRSRARTAVRRVISLQMRSSSSLSTAQARLRLASSWSPASAIQLAHARDRALLHVLVDVAQRHLLEHRRVDAAGERGALRGVADVSTSAEQVRRPSLDTR
jgi:hypothetical protein